MVLLLSQLKPAKGAAKKKKRIGRGNASGHGTYSGRGQKGQKSRSGVSGLKRLGMKQVLLRTPKKRGFKSYYAKNQVVNLSALGDNYADGETVSPATLYRKGLINDPHQPVKILAGGSLKNKKLLFKSVKMSANIKPSVAPIAEAKS
jgi:large subunit ribosomal protein L15